MKFLTKLFGKKDVNVAVKPVALPPVTDALVAPSHFSAKAKTKGFSARSSFVAKGYQAPSTRPVFNSASDNDGLYDFRFGRFHDGASHVGYFASFR